MTVLSKIYVDSVQPQVISGLWLKDGEDGYELFVIENGVANPLKLKGEGKPRQDKKDFDAAGFMKKVKGSIIGSVQDEAKENTINGAKAYAENVAAAVLGNEGDAPADMTLYGLKAYIDKKLKKK